MVEDVGTIGSEQEMADYVGDTTEGTESLETKAPSFLDALFTPEGITMFSLAIIVDVLEIVLDITGVGAVAALALDIAAYVIIGGWMMARSSDVKVSEKAAETLKKATKEQFTKFSAQSEKWAKRLRWARITMPIFEMIPFVSIVPCWIVGVYFELKYGKQV